MDDFLFHTFLFCCCCLVVGFLIWFQWFWLNVYCVYMRWGMRKDGRGVVQTSVDDGILVYSACARYSEIWDEQLYTTIDACGKLNMIFGIEWFRFCCVAVENNIVLRQLGRHQRKKCKNDLELLCIVWFHFDGSAEIGVNIDKLYSRSICIILYMLNE